MLNISSVTLLQSLSFVREGFTKLSPAQAGAILRECAYDRQRKIDVTHAGTLREIMRRGSWAQKDKLDFARFPDGTLKLVNGYHRMTAQAESGCDIIWTIAIHDVANETAAHQLYFKFDTNVRKRSANNILQGTRFAEQYGLTNKVALALYGAAPIIASGMRVNKGGSKGGVVSAEDLSRRLVDLRLEKSVEFAPMARVYQGYLNDASAALRAKLLIAGITAVALVTIKHQPEVAAEFWHGLALNDGLRRDDPRSALLADLMARTLNKGGSQQALFVPARAWTAHFKREPLKIIKCHANARTIIAGTPYSVSM